jgi:hypothetical protein
MDPPKEPEYPNTQYTRDHDTKRFVWSQQWKQLKFRTSPSSLVSPASNQKISEESYKCSVSSVNYINKFPESSEYDSNEESWLSPTDSEAYSAPSERGTLTEDAQSSYSPLESLSDSTESVGSIVSQFEAIALPIGTPVSPVKVKVVPTFEAIPLPIQNVFLVQQPTTSVENDRVSEILALATVPQQSIPVPQPSEVIGSTLSTPGSSTVRQDVSVRPKVRRPLPTAQVVSPLIDTTSPQGSALFSSKNVPLYSKFRPPSVLKQQIVSAPTIQSTDQQKARARRDARLEKVFLDVQTAIVKKSWKDRLENKFNVVRPTRPSLHVINEDGTVWDSHKTPACVWRCSSEREIRQLTARAESAANPTDNYWVNIARNILSEDEDDINNPRQLRLSRIVNLSVERSVPGPPMPVDFDNVYLDGVHIPRSQQVRFPRPYSESSDEAGT